MKKQYIFLVLIVVVSLVFLWWWSVTPTNSAADNAPLTIDERIETGVHRSDISIKSSSSNNTLQQAVNDLGSPMGDPATAEEIRGWFADRGNYAFLGLDYLSDYRAYDMDTLIRLSDAGDLKAMHVISERLNNFNDVRGVLWKAALYGSTAALAEIGSMNENDEGNLNNMPIKRKKEKIIEAFAYYEVAQMRGDWWGTLSSGKSLTDRYQIELTDEDKQKISDRAEVLYSDLQLKRTQRGLGEFDNTVPDFVMQFYENILRAQ